MAIQGGKLPERCSETLPYDYVNEPVGGSPKGRFSCSR